MSFIDRVLRTARQRITKRASQPPYRLGRDLSIAVPFDYMPTPVLVRIAVVIHMFHAEMATELLNLCSNIPGPTDIFISTDTSAKANTVRHAFAAWDRGTVVVRLAPNRGRDMPSKFVTFHGELADYDLILFLHSKKSVYLETGINWRQVLFGSLAGNDAIVASILSMFEADRSLGIIFPQHYEQIRDRLQWGANRRRAGTLATRLGISLNRSQSLDFTSGSMFWARPDALAPLWSLNLKIDDFDPEESQLDGTIAHALERLILYSAEHAGYSWIKVGDPIFYADTDNIITISSPDQLSAAMQHVTFRLLPD